MLRFQVCVVVLTTFLAACSVISQDQLQPATPPLPTRAPSPLATRAASPRPTPGSASELNVAARNAIDDLAAKLKIAAGKVQVVSVEEVDWPDTSMGCPQPGRFYAQVIVQGYRIILSAEGQQVVYHSDLQGHVGTCPNK